MPIFRLRENHIDPFRCSLCAETLGNVILSHDDLLEGKGERKEYNLVVDKKLKVRAKPRLVLRFKEASDADAEFMHVLRERLGDVGICADETFLPPRPPDSKILKRMTKRSGHTELHRVKPFPAPNDVERTKWMSRTDIQAEALKQSQSWIEAGSGKLGKLYVEVIGCDDLPNMDSQTLDMRDKTDAFACLVFEDAIVNTDVIGDTLRPRWMPWSCRAFCFNISHPQSDLYLGVFDWDPPNSIAQAATRTYASVHDPIGRVAISLGRYLPNTTYDVALPLYYSEEAAQKKKTSGSILIRFRIEWLEARKAIIKGALPPDVRLDWRASVPLWDSQRFFVLTICLLLCFPKPMYVSCNRRINWSVAHYTVSGPASDSAFSINKITSYLEELKDNEKLIPRVIDIALNLFLWRAGFNMKVFGKVITVPIHSMTAFAWGLLVSWDLNWLPAFLFFAIGWAFLAMNQHARQIPSPWHRATGRYHLASYFKANPLA
jgi:hypothetical protein